MWRKRPPGTNPIKAKGEISLAPIVGDAAVAEGHIAEGRLIPLVIIDAEVRPDIAELIRAHQHTPPGDVTCRWGQLQGSKDRVALFLHFTKPIQLSAALEFEIVRQGILVEQMLVAKCLYLQPGKPGDRISTSWKVPRILIEVPDTGFREAWDYLFERNLVADFKRRGLSRQQAKQVTKEALSKLRQFGSVRAHREGTKAMVFSFQKPK